MTGPRYCSRRGIERHTSGNSGFNNAGHRPNHAAPDRRPPTSILSRLFGAGAKREASDPAAEDNEGFGISAALQEAGRGQAVRPGVLNPTGANGATVTGLCGPCGAHATPGISCRVANTRGAMPRRPPQWDHHAPRDLALSPENGATDTVGDGKNHSSRISRSRAIGACPGGVCPVDFRGYRYYQRRHALVCKWCPPGPALRDRPHYLSALEPARHIDVNVEIDEKRVSNTGDCDEYGNPW